MRRAYRKTAGAAFGLLLLAGCASVQQYTRMDTFERASKTYAKAISWSNFEDAATFLPPDRSAGPPPDLEALKRIRVTSYRLKQFKAAPDASEVRQDVEISYYLIDDMRLKTLRDPQHWVYESSADRWYIRSGLPDFQQNMNSDS